MELIIVWLLFGFVAMMIANSKGRSGAGWFLLGCLLGPFSLVVVIFPSLKIDPHAPTDKTQVRCPGCRELILQDAAVCKHCGSQINGNYLPFGKAQTPQKNDVMTGVGKLACMTADGATTSGVTITRAPMRVMENSRSAKS